MKNLFFVFLLAGFTPVFTQESIAQRSLNSLQFSDEPRTLKFIDGIEIRGEGISITEPADLPSAQTSANRDHLPLIEQQSSLQFKYAQLLNKEVELITNIPLFTFIEDWWETRYRYGGTSKSGIDCSAFTGMLQSAVYGIQLPRTARDQYHYCSKISREELKEGDLLFFNTRGGISHVGVYLSDGYFAHSSTSQGVTISSLEDDYYRARFIGGGRPEKNVVQLAAEENCEE